MSSAPNRPQVAMLSGDVLELVIVDADGLFKALPGAQPIAMPAQWRAALAAHNDRQVLARGAPKAPSTSQVRSLDRK